MLYGRRLRCLNVPGALQVVDRLEATLRVKRFNQLGGLQLDRDVRHMVVTLSEARSSR